jgi:hypothetical protein
MTMSSIELRRVGIAHRSGEIKGNHAQSGLEISMASPEFRPQG